MKKKHVLIPWSGGFDSTLLLLQALEAGHKVTTFSTLIRNNKSIWKLEENSRNKIREILNGVGKFWNHSSIPAFEIDLPHNAEHLAISQGPVWAFSIGMLAQNLKFTKTPVDEVWMGYKMNDCMLSYLDEFESLVRSIQKFSWEEYQNFELVYPLLKKPRTSIIKEITEMNLEVATYCYTCEFGNLPTFQADTECTCPSCSSLNSACGSYGTFIKKNRKAIAHLNSFTVAEDILERECHPDKDDKSKINVTDSPSEESASPYLKSKLVPNREIRD